MLRSWLGTAAAGAIGGAAIAVAVIFMAAALGVFPPDSDAYIHDYLLRHPQVLVEAGNKLQAQQDANEDDARQAAVGRLGAKAFFNPKLAFITGLPSAPITFVEFFDYNCPYCRASVPSVKRFMAAHTTDARFAFVEFPIKGPQSTIASRSAIAARNQRDKYLAFHFLLMGERELVTEDVVYADAKKVGLNIAKLKADMRDHSIDAAIAGAHSLAAAAKVDGTPAFIVNGHIHEGAINDAVLRHMLKRS